MKKKRNEETEILVPADMRIVKKGESKEPKMSKVKKFFRRMSRLSYNFLYSFVLRFFKIVNRGVRPSYSALVLWAMKRETSEHVKFLIKVFKWVVFPASILYVCAGFCFFGENALDSMFLGMLIFLYSNFLPDLPSIYRKKKENSRNEDLLWEEKYALLLFAPVFIAAFLCGVRLRWKTAETFHNFKSLTIYTAFLFVLGFFAFVDFPILIGDITEILSLPFYGLIGYLTHLKVDKVW
ncbi:MAG: hypothetical protein OEY83_07700 [Candidatus Bathyarchaeota archaeon]|nr:hypothetical protein [Candidatus Bathyarchaeota archaeon]MDH5713802.1 hypothetical protein [Candidatus Bathyarchaeota archaeon]